MCNGICCGFYFIDNRIFVYIFDFLREIFNYIFFRFRDSVSFNIFFVYDNVKDCGFIIFVRIN